MGGDGPQGFEHSPGPRSFLPDHAVLEWDFLVKDALGVSTYPDLGEYETGTLESFPAISGGLDLDVTA